jgi:hypothetical protein
MPHPLLILLTALGAPTALLSQRCAPAADSDVYHPKSFVRIIEVDRDQNAHLLFGPPLLAAHDSRRLQRSHREVDRKSRIYIQYDRQRLSCLDGVQVAIEGHVKGDKSLRSVEIPGYSVVGEKSTAAVISFVGPLQLSAIGAELRRSWDATQHSVDSIFAAASGASRAEYTAAFERVRRADSALAAARIDSAAAATSARAVAQDSQLVRNDSVQRVVASNRQRYEAAVRDAAREAATARTELEKLDRQPTNGPPRTAAASAAGRVIAADYDSRDIVEKFGDSVGEALVVPVAAVLNRAPDLIERSISRTVRDYQELDSALAKNDPAGSPALLALIQDLRRGVTGIVNDFQLAAQDPGGFKVASLAPLRDADFSVQQSGAQIGEQIIVTLTTIHGRDKRSTDVIIEVNELGVVGRVGDSFLFIKRRGIEKDLAEKSVNDWLGQFRAATPLGRAIMPSQVDVPSEENFGATPGVNFGWVYLPRDEDSKWKGAMRALKVGWGVNASFPSFTTRHYTIKAPTDSATQPTLGTPTIDKQNLGLSAGLYSSVFDGAMAITYGWNLTVSSKRQYWGLGLSFIGLAKQGREFFQKIAQQ